MLVLPRIRPPAGMPNSGNDGAAPMTLLHASPPSTPSRGSERPQAAIIGESRGIRLVLDQVDRIASTSTTTVLIDGPSGVGKELVARAIHDSSRRSGKPFVAVNCAALPENLFEAELFGYASGAFTGGKPGGHEGLTASAEGGTLFLDEVGEIPLALQAKLLRFLQERTYRRIGENEDRAMDVRVLAATHRDLESMVESGAFREDLYYRLNVLSLRVPALRERAEDVLPIAIHYLQQFAEELNSPLTGFTAAAASRLVEHSWPGNVRELRNTIERAAVLAGEGEIDEEHLGLPGGSRSASTSGSAPLPVAGVRAMKEEGIVLSVPDLDLRNVERVVIERALELSRGNRSQAARDLGINRTTLYNKLRQYGIEA